MKTPHFFSMFNKLCESLEKVGEINIWLHESGIEFF